ncbi:MAG: CopG family transcriptional regulator [Pseudomonadota bacterium]
MAGVKTAISLQKDLFNQVNNLAKEMHVSRSHLFTLAVEDYLKKNESKKILAKINAAYDDVPSEEETRIAQAMRRKQRKNIEAEAW